MLDKFVVEHAVKKKPKRLEMYDRCVDLLKPIVADFGPHQLTASDVTQIVRAVGQKNGATTANQCRATLSAAFSFAIDLGLATSNPVRDTKKIAIPKRKRYVENSELDAIGAAGSPVIKAVIDLAYVTGQRISDVLDLSLDSRDKEYVTLVQRKTGHRMKLRRTRGLTTVIKAATATCKKQLRKSAREKGVEPETIVFNSLGLPYTYDGFSTLWQRARKESGIQDARIHDVRAKAITDAEEFGMDAQALAGHASRTTTEGYIRRRKAFIADTRCRRCGGRGKGPKGLREATGAWVALILRSTTSCLATSRKRLRDTRRGLQISDGRDHPARKLVISRRYLVRFRVVVVLSRFRRSQT